MTRLFETGATRDTDASKLDYEGFLSPRVLQCYAEYMHECRLRNIPPGQEVRSSDNWQKGIPKDAYMKSLLRHVMDVWTGHRGGTPQPGSKLFVNALCAIMFNAMGYLFEVLKEEGKSYGTTNGPAGSGGRNLSGVSKSESVDKGEQAVLEVPQGSIRNDDFKPIPGCWCPECSKSRSSRKLRS